MNYWCNTKATVGMQYELYIRRLAVTCHKCEDVLKNVNVHAAERRQMHDGYLMKLKMSHDRVCNAVLRPKMLRHLSDFFFKTTVDEVTFNVCFRSLTGRRSYVFMQFRLHFICYRMLPVDFQRQQFTNIAVTSTQSLAKCALWGSSKMSLQWVDTCKQLCKN